MTTPIPQPPGIPLLGNIFDVNPSNTWASLKTLAEKYGEIFQITVLNKTIVFVASAALAEELCDEKRFRKYVGGPIVEIRHAVNDALFTAYANEPSWGIAHRICAPRLSRDAVSQWCGEMVDVTGELVAKWQRNGGDGGGCGDGPTDGISLIDELNRLNLEATTLTLFGKKLGCIDAAAPHAMLAGMEDATSEAMLRPTRPGLVNWLFYGRKRAGATRVMREEYAADLVRHRREGGGGGDKKKGLGGEDSRKEDLLSALLGATDPETGRGLTESQVVDEIVSMPIGSSTAPCVVATAVYYLLRNPACVAEARRELDEVLGPWDKANEAATERKKKLGAEHLPRLRYIEGIVRESLRLSFAAPGFNIEPIPRTTTTGDNGEKVVVDRQPVLLAGGRYQVAHDQPMIVVLAGANRDPAVYAEPLAFRPERMVGAALEALPPGARRWFGNGRRECIGRHWAWQFCVVVVAALLRDVDFEAVDEGYELAQDGWFNLRPVGFRVRAMPRRA